jgi:hypothetical protein
MEICPGIAGHPVDPRNAQGCLHGGAVLARGLAVHPEGRPLAQYRGAEGDFAHGETLKADGQRQARPGSAGGLVLVGGGCLRQAIQGHGFGFEGSKPQGGVEKRRRIELVADPIDGEPRARAIADAQVAYGNREGEPAAQAADLNFDFARRGGKPFNLPGGPVPAGIALEVVVAKSGEQAEQQRKTGQRQAEPLSQLFHARHVRTPDRSLYRTEIHRPCRAY